VSRRAKRLNELVLDGTFEARRPHHRALLFEDDVRDPALREIQERFLECDNEFEQRAIAKEFEEAIKHGAGAPPSIEELQAELRKLGPDGSAKQAIAFFPRYLRWDDGTPFELDPFQKEVLELALEMDERGRYLWTQIDLWIPRGNGKTPLLSGLGGLATLTTPGRPKILQLAGDGEQAKLGLELLQRLARGRRARLLLRRLLRRDPPARRPRHVLDPEGLRHRRARQAAVQDVRRRALGPRDRSRRSRRTRARRRPSSSAPPRTARSATARRPATTRTRSAAATGTAACSCPS
jgi:hypothetical protein